MPKKQAKKPPARNFVLETITKSKGRGKNKVTTATAKKERFQKRLYCLPINAPAKGKKGKAATKFQCFTSFDDATAAFAVGLADLPVPVPARKPVFSPANAAAYEAAMKGLRGRRGLRGTPAEHATREGIFDGAAQMVRKIIDDEHLDLPERERRSLNTLYGKLRAISRENGSWADPDMQAEMLDPREPWGYVHADREVPLLERYGDNDLRAALARARGSHF